MNNNNNNKTLTRKYLLSLLVLNDWIREAYVIYDERSMV